MRPQGLDILEELERLELARASQRYESDEEAGGSREEDTIVVTTQVCVCVGGVGGVG